VRNLAIASAFDVFQVFSPQGTQRAAEKNKNFAKYKPRTDIPPQTK
jgi:hypothetical protein